ncbi:MAG: DNA repair protein RadC [Candidatus Cloacimonetes bacterium]|nr:DNA repair protein RadC [Candidatus Cloacimonadota bacterium]
MGTPIDNIHADHKRRLRDKFLNSGLEGFHNYEVLELILSYSLIRKDTKQLAKQLIDKFGNLTEVINAPEEILLTVEGLGERSITLLKLIKEAGSYHLREALLKKRAVKSSEDIYDYFKFYFKGSKIEEFKAIFLNNQNHIIFEETLFTGTINESRVYIRKIVERIVLLKAMSLIVIHNHPSGIINPSTNDINLTKRIQQALSLIEAQLLDHIIIGDNDYYSFAKNGIL